MTKVWTMNPAATLTQGAFGGEDSWGLEEQWGPQGKNESTCAVRDDLASWEKGSVCDWCFIQGVRRARAPRSLFSGDFMCVRVCTHHLKIVTSALQRVARDGSGKWLWHRWPSSARTTAQILLWFTLTVISLSLSLSQVVVVVSSSTAASPALGELESIPAVFKRRWGKTLDLWPVYLRAT